MRGVHVFCRLRTCAHTAFTPSTWLPRSPSLPPSQSGVVADCSSSKPLHDAWSETKTSPNRKVSPPKKNSLPPSSQLEAKTKSFPLAKPPTGSKTALPSHRAAHVSGRGKMDRAYPPNVGKGVCVCVCVCACACVRACVCGHYIMS